MNRNKEMIQKLNTLIKDNPTLDVEISGESEDSDFFWSHQKIVRVDLSCWVDINGFIYTDEDVAKDELHNILYDGQSESELESLVNRQFDELSRTVIRVWTEFA